jgi:hypothetical protein
MLQGSYQASLVSMVGRLLHCGLSSAGEARVAAATACLVLFCSVLQRGSVGHLC